MRNTFDQPPTRPLVALSSVLLLLASCAESAIVDSAADQSAPPARRLQQEISFAAAQHNNATRATLLQQVGHYSFGVFGYKDNDTANPVFQNYLVGYYDKALAYGQPSGSTFGDPDAGLTGVSLWMYEGMGAEEYTGPYAGQPLTDEHRSNLTHQYMRYWDKESASTSFYAYAPYVHGPQTATFDNRSKLLTLPAATMHDGYDDPSLYEYLYATTTVEQRDYGNDVYLPFRRLGCKVNIRFYEVIEGYTAEILDLGNGYEGIQATPSIRTGEAPDYRFTDGEFYRSAGATVSFASSVPVVNLLSPAVHAKGETLHFERPMDPVIGTSADGSTLSPTTYYGIPKPESTGGFTFHVSYRLTSDMNEQITVRNATAYIPADKCNWRPNFAYTYIFKITRESNGSTDSDDDPSIDPSDPEVSPDIALYSIVFDRCTVEDWKTEELEKELGKK